MKTLHIMMAKDLLELQMQQMYLRQEELKLCAKVIKLDLELGLCTQTWYEDQQLKISTKSLIYRHLIENYQMQTNAIGKAEQKESEELKELAELATHAFVGDDDHAKENPLIKEEVTDTSYEVVEEEAKKVIDNGVKENVLKDD